MKATAVSAGISFTVFAVMWVAFTAEHRAGMWEETRTPDYVMGVALWLTVLLLIALGVQAAVRAIRSRRLSRSS